MPPGCKPFIEYPIEKGSIELMKGELYVKLGLENIKQQPAILKRGLI
jgi:hypothetical protein